MSLATFQALVLSFARDDNGKLTNADRDAAIEAAVRRYSSDRPQITVEDVTSVAGGQELELPDSYQAGFSRIESLEYPIGDIPPSYLDHESWSMYRKPTEEVIHLAAGLPANADVRVTVGTRHVLDAMTDTLPVEDIEAVAKWAAAFLCDQLSAVYANNSDSTISADTVKQESQSGNYRRLANDYRKAYNQHIGVDEERSAAAGTEVSFNRADSLGGERMFSHGSRR